MADQTIDRHIEECGKLDPSMGGAVGCPELGYMIPVLPYDHLLVLPELRQDTPHFLARPVPLQGLQ